MDAKPLTDLSQLDQIDDASHERKIVIFKHSTACAISGMALNRLQRKWDSEALQCSDFYLLDLIANRSISNEIAIRYGVRHQSPQVLIISQGRCVFDTSHFAINFKQLAQAAAC